MNERICRRIVMERADARCERCSVHGSVRGLTMHHRIKRSQGGPWTPENIVWVCGHGTTPHGCHAWVEHNPNEADIEGFHVRPWEALSKPVFYRGIFVTLDNAGGFERVATPTQEAE